jgi:hypothetical protein
VLSHDDLGLLVFSFCQKTIEEITTTYLARLGAVASLVSPEKHQEVDVAAAAADTAVRYIIIFIIQSPHKQNSTATI